MKKLIIFLLFVICARGIQAQHSLIYNHSDALFEQGKELYQQQKFAASYRSFEQFLAEAPVIKAGQRHEASYYLLANAFELRQDNSFKQLEDFLRQQPYTPYRDHVNSMLGILLYEQKDFRKAMTYFDRVKPSRLAQRAQAEHLFSRGYSLLEIADYAQARDIFRDLKERESAHKTPSLYYYSFAEYALKNFGDARPGFLALETDERYQQKIAYYLLQIYFHEGDKSEVNRRAALILTQYPNNPDNAEVYRIRGEMAYQEERFNDAIEDLIRYERMSPQVLRNDLYILGIAHIKTLRYNSAIPYLQRVTTGNDQLTENAYLHLGNAFVRINDKNNARLAFEAALRTNFDRKVREEALFNYALTTYETNSAFGESISAFEQFLNEFPNSRSANLAKSYLASEYMATRNYQVALESIQRMKDPNDKILEAKQYLLFQLGTEAFTQNNFERAVSYFTQSIQTATMGTYAGEAYYWRSESYYRLGLNDNSINDLQTFLASSNARRSKNFIPAHYSMGYAYFSKKNYTEARRFFELYTRLEPNKQSDVFADALSRIGDCLFYARDFQNAEVQYTRSANLSPNTGDYALFQSAYTAGLQRKYTTKISRMNSLVQNYPNSEYADDALYEIGRSYLMVENENEALRAYRMLLERYPNSAMARKGALEIGMVYLNKEELPEAITSFKAVISRFPGSVEAFTALESLENVYVELNNVPAYLSYLNSIDMKSAGISVSREDSISFVAAERQYMAGNYPQAISGFRLYLRNYCSGGRYCTTAQYYLADSYYRSNDMQNALAEFINLQKIRGNQYLEEAYMRAAEITYDQKNYQTSIGYFREFEKVAQSAERRSIARLGILRCSFYLNDYRSTIDVAREIIDDPRSGNDVIAEARFNRAKALIATGASRQAIDDIRLLSADTRTAIGAESKFLLSKVYFDIGDLSNAEKEVLDFARKNTPYQYWLARGFIVLSDVYIQQKNDFQAKQYLLSLQRNYKEPDDVQSMIQQRLNGIAEREKSRVIN